ncbi:putative transmembrane protein [Toxoplasma gondii MAS]|uniref:Putative transmembrane protein n=1 Tax=Toxoplasma gondii MAS TaxID=943118 RepID=A0A086QRH7_TOXGO|nr:putative transmembrane protein [Toxoplasma gondii MAS]
MVVVVNGELLPDSDPRAVRSRQQRGHSPAATSSDPSSISGSGVGLNARSLSSFLPRVTGAGQASRGRERGHKVTLPALAFIGKPAVEVPVYVLVVAALLIALLGAQGAVFVAVVYLFYTPWAHEEGNRSSSVGRGGEGATSPGIQSSPGPSSTHRDRRVLGEEEREARIQRLMQQKKDGDPDKGGN